MISCHMSSQHQRHDGEEAANGEQSSSGFSDDLDSSDGVGTRFVGCLSMFNASPSMTDHEHGDQKLPHNNYSLQRSLSRIRPHAGVTLPVSKQLFSACGASAALLVSPIRIAHCNIILSFIAHSVL